MPSPIILQDTSGLGEGISAFGGALGQALQYLGQENKKIQQQQKNATILQNTLGKLQPDASPTQIISAYNKALGQLPPDVAKAAFAAYEPVLKEGIKSQAQAKLLQELGLMPRSQEPMQTMIGGSQTPPQQQEPAPLANPISTWDEDKLVMAQASGVQGLQKMAEAELKRRSLEDRRNIEERKYRTETGKEIEKKISALRESLPKKKFASQMARQAVESGEVGAFSLANLAQRMGVPEFQSAKGAQLITASKENLLSNMSRVSARGQNLWFEQRLNSMFPQIGQSAEANLTTATMIDAENEMDELYLQAFDEISQQDEAEKGYVDYRTIERRARKQIEEQEQDVFDKTMFNLRQLYEQEKGEQWILDNAMKKVPKGTPITPKMMGALAYKYGGDPKKTIENAKKLGYTIPTRGDLERWR